MNSTCKVPLNFEEISWIGNILINITWYNAISILRISHSGPTPISALIGLSPPYHYFHMTYIDIHTHITKKMASKVRWYIWVLLTRGKKIEFKICWYQINNNINCTNSFSLFFFNLVMGFSVLLMGDRELVQFKIVQTPLHIVSHH